MIVEATARRLLPSPSLISGTYKQPAGRAPQALAGACLCGGCSLRTMPAIASRHTASCSTNRCRRLANGASMGSAVTCSSPAMHLLRQRWLSGASQPAPAAARAPKQHGAAQRSTARRSMHLVRVHQDGHRGHDVEHVATEPLRPAPLDHEPQHQPQHHGIHRRMGWAASAWASLLPCPTALAPALPEARLKWEAVDVGERVPLKLQRSPELEHRHYSVGRAHQVRQLRRIAGADDLRRHGRV